jgi:GTPase Era involved in 16S rRNA processing
MLEAAEAAETLSNMEVIVGVLEVQEEVATELQMVLVLMVKLTPVVELVEDYNKIPQQAEDLELL